MVAVAVSHPSLSEFRAIERQLRGLVADVDGDQVAPDSALGWVRVFDQIERLAAAAKSLVARRVEDAQLYRQAGYKTAARQLAAETGITITAARATLDTSYRLTDLPVVDAALRAGQLSRAQADPIADAAEVVPTAEARLVEFAAETTVAQLRDECLRTKASVGRDKTYARIRKDRYVRTKTDGEGAWTLHARGPADAGAQIMRALETRIREIFEQARNTGAHESRDAYAFDALVQLANDADRQPEPRPDANDNTTTAPNEKPKPKRSSDPKWLALIRLDLAALVRGDVEGAEVCEIPGIGPIPVTVARSLLSDAVLKLVITNGVDVLNVTNLGRGATAAQRIALLWSSPQCTNLDCNGTHLQIDHRDPWTRVKRTDLDNLDPLCDFDHWLKTHNGWSLIDGKGRRAFVAPDDPRHPNHQRPPPDTS